MLDAINRVMRKPQQVPGYISGLTGPELPTPASRTRRQPDGPVTMKLDIETNLHVPSPFRIGFVVINAERKI